jgi:hypothetical protein
MVDGYSILSDRQQAPLCCTFERESDKMQRWFSGFYQRY